MIMSINSLNKYATNDFYKLKSMELVLKLREGKLFLNKHKPSIGFWGEYILRGFLKEILPSGIKVAQGFIHHNGFISHQCDIILYDSIHYASLAQFGEIEVIPQAAVKAVIEVKNSIQRKSFQKTLDDFDVLGQIGILNKYLFIYSSVKPEAIHSYFFEKNNEESVFPINETFAPKYDHGSFQFLPTGIISLLSDYLLGQDYVTQDMMGYTAYQCVYSSQKTKINELVSSLQWFLGILFDNCLNDSQEMTSSESQNIEFDDIKEIYAFGLWNM